MAKKPEPLHSVKVQSAEEAVVEAWEAFLGTHYRGQANEVAAGYPETRSVRVDYWDLDRHNQPLAEHLLIRPTNVLFAAEKAIEAIPLPVDPPPRLHVRVVRLPDVARIQVRKLRSGHIGRLVSIEGLVKRASDVQARVEDALFKCLRCDALVQEPQDEHLVLKEPLQCYEDQGGCGHSSGFKLMTEKSRFVDSQKVEMQEPPESLKGGQQPQRLVLWAEDDLAGVVNPGERVIANGILRSHPRKVGGAKSTMFERHLQVVSWELQQQAYEEIHLKPEEERELLALAADSGIYDRLVGSIAPSLHGLQSEKLAVVLQMFSGGSIQYGDGRTTRGEVHVLLVGDPGLGKSELLRYAARASPRGVFTSGKSSSAAGLTAAAVKDSDDRWSVEAGALVLANQGLCCVDEIENMKEEDRVALHGALEQGVVNKDTAGVHVELPAHCSLLAAGNPREGRFDTKYGSLSEQIDLSPPLLSRFDVIFVQVDRPHEARDRAAIRALLNLDVPAPAIPAETLRKFVAYARRRPPAHLAPEAAQRIEDYYWELRKPTEADGPLRATLRQGAAIHRLAQASARVRLGDRVTIADVDRAIALVEAGLRSAAGGEPGGLWDIDKIVSGTSHNQRDRIHAVIAAVEDLQGTTPDGAHVLDICARAKGKGTPEEIQDVLSRLVDDGRLYQPRGSGTEWFRRP